MNIAKALAILVAISFFVAAAPARAELSGAGGGPFAGPLAIRSTERASSSGPDYTPGGIYAGVGAMGYAEFESLRVGIFGVGAAGGEDAMARRSTFGMGGLTLEMLLRPSGREFVVPLGIVLGAGAYSVQDMSMSGMPGGRYDYSDDERFDAAATLYETPFFVTGPRVGFAKEVLPWLRIEGNASFLALFRDDGTSYSFMMTIGPTFGRFDFDRPPAPGCEHDYPGCGAPPAGGYEQED